MQDSHPPESKRISTRLAPPHEEIEHYAQALWIQYGKPADRDLAIWLEAEQHLLSLAQAEQRATHELTPSSEIPPAEKARASACTTIKASALEHPTTYQPKMQRSDLNARTIPSAPGHKR